MNVQEYISSGIIESYVLGLATREERIEFERMCAAHSEVKVARDNFEHTLEKRLEEQGITPPKHLKSKIFAELEVENDHRPEKILPLNQRPEMRAGWLRYMAAASVILLIGSTILNFYFFTQYKKYVNRSDELIAKQARTEAAAQTMQKKLGDYQSAMDLIKNPAMEVVRMPSVPSSPHPASMTTVFWNTNTKDVYLMVNNLPQPEVNKQYQLWAIVDGKPVDAGVFDMGEGTSLMKMKNIPLAAQAFAITLEKKGGSPTPSMDAMYVMGRVSI
ncbi:MAG: hypothetical protein C5B59_10505 [Bacteroidetes bacterium]|nr:MAG: hypothetical protein C5B59_10505 [Bacteroidota bacterium]